MNFYCYLWFSCQYIYLSKENSGTLNIQVNMFRFRRISLPILDPHLLLEKSIVLDFTIHSVSDMGFKLF